MARLIEIVSSGLDEYLQGFGGDPWGGSSAMGLRVPTLATPNKDRRYLFLLASITLGEGTTATIKGYRQFSSLGTTLSAGRYIEQEIQSPNFRLPDGNISWSLRRLGPPNAAGFPRAQAPGLDLPSFKKYWADGSCLLYQDYTIAAANRLYPQLTSYVPPNLGRPWGTSLSAGQQGLMTDQRTYWRSSQAWSSLDVHVEGPDTIALFASVYQSAGTYSVVAPPVNFSNGISSEEAFIGNFGAGSSEVPHPIYWRVGGALIVEVQKGFVGP